MICVKSSIDHLVISCLQSTKHQEVVYVAFVKGRESGRIEKVDILGREKILTYECGNFLIVYTYCKNSNHDLYAYCKNGGNACF